jgi:sulfur carrier protein
MSAGFNSNVRVGEIVYHVQTEQRGADGGVIDTVVYIAGRVIHRAKTNFRDDEARDDSAARASDRVERQHKNIIAQLESGALPQPAGVLDHLALRADRVAIERNGEILAKSAWSETAISPNDRFEIVQLVGGG